MSKAKKNTMRMSTRWMFTVNNPTHLFHPDNIRFIGFYNGKYYNSSDGTGIIYLSFSEELGDSGENSAVEAYDDLNLDVLQGNYHLQCYLETNKAVSRRTVKMYLNCNEAANVLIPNDPDAADKYTRKQDETFVGGPYCYGTRSVNGVSSNYMFAVEAAKQRMPLHQIIENFPLIWLRHERSLMSIRLHYALKRTAFPFAIYIHGPSGTGKSYFSKSIASFMNARIYRHSYDNNWFHGYDQEEICVFDEYRGQFQWSYFLKIVDENEHVVPQKNGYMQFNSPIIVFTSSKPMSHHYQKKAADEREWKQMVRRISLTIEYVDGKYVMIKGERSLPVAVEFAYAEMCNFLSGNSRDECIIID